LAYTVHDPQAFFAAIVARIASSTGKTVGLAEAPASNVYPYAVVYPLGDESSEGSLPDPTQAVTWSWQVTCVGTGAAGAQWMQQKVRAALHGHIPTVAGLGTTPIELADGSGITRDDGLSGNPTLFYSTDRFIALTSV
jgi:hypothetical protein